MTNFYDHALKNELMKDKCLILLIESFFYCKENNQDGIKRSDLLRLCNNKLNELSKGVRPKFGGSFEACLKKHSDTSISPDNRLLTVERSNVKHDTQIYPNIDLIEKHLRAKRLFHSYTHSYTVIKRVQSSYYENPSVNAVVGVRVRRATSKGFLEDIKTELSSFLKSELVEIRLDPGLHLSDDTRRQLETLLEQFAFDNSKAKEDFTIVLEYLGIPTSLVTLARSGKQQIFFNRLSLYFQKWLKDYHMVSISEDEMTGLVRGDLDWLGQDARKKFGLFLSSIRDHCDSSHDTDNPLLPIIAEMQTHLITTNPL